MRPAAVAVAVVVACVLAGANGAGPSSSSASSASSPKSSSSSHEDDKPATPPDAFTGISVAAHATELVAPDASIRIGGSTWNNWGPKLIGLTEDGTTVKTGDVIARFDFQGRDQLEGIKNRIAAAEAKAQSRKLEAQNQVDSLKLDRKKKELDAELARIDVEKERALSKRQAEIYKITKRIADFEVQALDKRIEGAERANAAEIEFQDLTVARAKGDLDRYKFYEDRFIMKAPHDGVIRHGFNGHEHRKYQKGDQLGSGRKLLSVAKDAALAVKFFVPEFRIRELQVGSVVVVTTPGSREGHKATVTTIDTFPQELGYLLDNDELPNAREKAFTVNADFGDDAAGISAGNELIVRIASAAATTGAPK